MRRLALFAGCFSWLEALSREDLVGAHVALTPTWNETADYADYVLPMGHSSERRIGVWDHN